MGDRLFQRYNGELYSYHYITETDIIEDVTGMKTNTRGTILLGLVSDNILDLIFNGDYVNDGLVILVNKEFCTILLDGKETIVKKDEVDNIITREKHKESRFYL